MIRAMGWLSIKAALFFWVGALFGMVFSYQYFTPSPHHEFREAIKDARFVKFTDEIIRLEGGFVLSDNGATYAGINRAAHPDSPLWKMDLSQTSTHARAEVYRIYMQDYYKRLHIHNLPEQIGFLIYDFGVNAGNYRSARTIQSLVFTDPHQIDGHIGPFTIAAINGAKGDLTHEFSLARMSYYVRLVVQNPEKYGGEIDGWEKRTKKALKFSQQLK